MRVATDIDGQTDREEMSREVERFLEENQLQRDPDRLELGNILTSPRASRVLGYHQMDYYTPVKAKT